MGVWALVVITLNVTEDHPQVWVGVMRNVGGKLVIITKHLIDGGDLILVNHGQDFIIKQLR